jgi:tetratricopeptide (TPR) repeat protein
MITRSLCSLALACLLTAAPAGCRDRQLAETDRDPAQTRRTLALAPSEGEGAVDRDLATAREGARAAGAPAQSWVRLAKAWVRKGRTTTDPGFLLSAEAAADEALSLAPGFRPALGIKAIALLGSHRFREAAALSRQILASDGEDLVALGVLSDALLELGDIPGATSTAQAMMDLKPSLPVYGRASYLRWLAGDEVGAREMIRLAIDSGRGARDKEPGAWVLVQAATLFWQAGDLEGADEGFAQALAQVPDYPPALLGRGRVALGRRDAAAAIRWLERAVALSPSVEGLWLLADARELAQDRAGAAEAQERLLREGARGDRLGLASYLAAKGRDTAEALRLLETERRARPGLYVEDAHAWALYRAGRLPEARAASDRARAFGTNDARLLYHAGAIRLAQGEVEEGRRLLRSALARNPHFDLGGAREATALLATTGVSAAAEPGR